MAGVRGLTYGVARNDVDYNVNMPVKIGNIVYSRCPYYEKWHSMLYRCFDTKHKKAQPTYIDVIVCEEWLSLTNFRSWMETQDWVGKCLDKDLLVAGNKLYSPETCIFVSQLINNFLTERKVRNGGLPIGVTESDKLHPYRSRCRNPFKNKHDHLGYFDNIVDAYTAWWNRKCIIAEQLASMESDTRVASAIMARYDVSKLDLSQVSQHERGTYGKE